LKLEFMRHDHQETAYIGGEICDSVQNLQSYIMTVLYIEEGEKRVCGTVQNLEFATLLH